MQLYRTLTTFTQFGSGPLLGPSCWPLQPNALPSVHEYRVEQVACDCLLGLEYGEQPLEALCIRLALWRNRE